MIYRLSEESKKHLLKLPETGLGYQILSAKKAKQFDLQKYVVFNAEIAIDFDNKLYSYSHTLNGNGYDVLLNVLNIIELEEVKVLELDNNLTDDSSNNINIPYNNINDIYIRPTLFNNDNRIDINEHKLLRGSLVTTIESYTNCHVMRVDPFEQYALPFKQDFLKLNYIKQNTDNVEYCGKFNPAFDKKGGGVKVRFLTDGKVFVKNSDGSYKFANDTNQVSTKY